MIIPKFGLMLILAGAAGMAQQPPPPPPQTPQPPVAQAARSGQITDAERRRFEDIKARHDRGEVISPEDQRFAQDIMARMNRTPRAAATPQPLQPPVPRQAPVPVNDADRRRFEDILARRDRGEVISPEDMRFAQEFMGRTSQTPRPAAVPQPFQPTPPPLERALGGPKGEWWTSPEMAQRLGLTSDQTKKMDDVFQQARLKLIDLDAAVRKEEVIMERLVSADQPDEAKIVAQIDKVAQARAELEKANARMLLGIRRLLTPDQWNKLKADSIPQPVRR